MADSSNLKKLLLKIGAVSGQTLWLIDASQFEDKTISLKEDFFPCLPRDMTKQVALMISPAQQRNLDSLTKATDVKTTSRGAIPEVDFVVRTWSPILNSGGISWCENFNNFEGMVLAGEHLRQRFPREKKAWRFTTRSKEHSTWETFEVRFEEPGFADLVLHQKDFQPPQGIHKKALTRLEEFLGDQAENILGHIQSRIKHSVARNRISLAVIQGDLGDFDSPHSDTMDRSIQLIPFIPVSVAGLHNVVPIGHFSKDLHKIIGQGDWDREFFFYNKLSQIFESEGIRSKAMEYLVRDTGNGIPWELDEIEGFGLGQSYGGHWTFLEDTELDDAEYREPYNYLTIDPDSHPYLLGQSICGAVAAMVVQAMLHPDHMAKTYPLKGWDLSSSTRWTEKAFNIRSMQVSNGPGNLWSIRSPVTIFGELTWTDLDFIRAGNK